MSQPNSVTDAQSLLLSMLQRMQINSKSSSYSIRNDQDAQQSLQQWIAAEGSDVGVRCPIPKWGGGPPEDTGARTMTFFHPDPVMGAHKKTMGNLEDPPPLGADGDPTSSIPRWVKRQVFPPPDHLDALIKNCPQSTENETRETVPIPEGPLSAHFGNSVPSTMRDHNSKKDNQHRLAHLAGGDKARWNTGQSQSTSVIWREPVQMSPPATATGPSPDLEPKQEANCELPLNLVLGPDTYQKDSKVSNPITSLSALKQTRNPTTATDIPNPVATSVGSHSGTQNMVAGIPPVPNCVWSRGSGRKKDLGRPPGVVEWDDTKGTLSHHQNLWENIRSKKKRRGAERKTARWTEKIKERWMDRHKSLEKNQIKSSRRSGAGEKDDWKRDEEKEELQSSHITWHRIMDKYVNDAPNKEEHILPPPIKELSYISPPTQTQWSTKGSHLSTFNEFEFSFAPTNLMEEIFTGEEWSNFLSPSRSPVTKETSRQSTIGGDYCTQLNQINDQGDMTEMERIPFEFRSKDSQWDIAPGGINHTMDRNTMKIKPGEVLVNFAQMSKVHSNRKREHSGTRSGQEPMRMSVRQEEGLSGKVEPKEGDATVYTSLQTANKTRVGTIPLYDFQDLTLPLSPRSAFHSSKVPDSESSTSNEVVIKKRKMEDGREGTRHVRFAEQLVFLPNVPFELNTPEHSEKPSQPAWILALKRKTRQKPEH